MAGASTANYRFSASWRFSKRHNTNNGMFVLSENTTGPASYKHTGCDLFLRNRLGRPAFFLSSKRAPLLLPCHLRRSPTALDFAPSHFGTCIILRVLWKHVLMLTAITAGGCTARTLNVEREGQVVVQHDVVFQLLDGVLQVNAVRRLGGNPGARLGILDDGTTRTTNDPRKE